jgi:hypothetical protein
MIALAKRFQIQNIFGLAREKYVFAFFLHFILVPQRDVNKKNGCLRMMTANETANNNYKRHE